MSGSLREMSSPRRGRMIVRFSRRGLFVVAGIVLLSCWAVSALTDTEYVGRMPSPDGRLVAWTRVSRGFLNDHYLVFVRTLDGREAPIAHFRNPRYRWEEAGRTLRIEGRPLYSEEDVPRTVFGASVVCGSR